jgi:hypothetical protein
MACAAKGGNMHRSRNRSTCATGAHLQVGVGVIALLCGGCPAPGAELREAGPLAEASQPDHHVAQREAAPLPDRARDLVAPLPPPWSKQLGTAADDHARAVALDAAGNVYVAGFTAGAVAGATALGAEDILVLKLGPDGKLLWARQLGTKERDLALAMAVDAKGQVYVTGSTTGDLEGTNAGNDGTCKSTSCPDLFVLKLDSSGTTLWTRQLGTKGDETANGIALDGSGVYVTGKTAGDLDGHTSAGWNDVFVIKYSLDGAKLWSQQFGGYSFDEGRAVAADGKGALLVTGYLAPATGNDDVFLSKRSADTGAELWQRTLASAGIVNEEGYAVAVDATGVFVCGYTMGALAGNTLTGFSDLFVARWALDGTPGWVKQIGATQVDPSFALASALFVGAGGNLYVTGFSNGSLGPASLGGDDLFVLKLGADGSQVWVKPIGGAGAERGHAIAGQGGRLVVVGDTSGSVDGNPNLGNDDILVKQLEP